MNLTPQLKVLNIILWILQCLLAYTFFMAGFTKLTMPIDTLVTVLLWTKDVPQALTRFIGTCEILGSIGLIIPALIRVKPILTAFAAVGIAMIMLLATFFHISRGEFQFLKITIILGLVASFVAWGRFKKVQITERKTN